MNLYRKSRFWLLLSIVCLPAVAFLLLGGRAAEGMDHRVKLPLAEDKLTFIFFFSDH